MKIIVAIVSCLFLTGCSTQRYCQPSKKSRDWAVKQWVKERSDGHFIVHTVNDFRKKRSIAEFRVKPDFRQLDSLREVL